MLTIKGLTLTLSGKDILSGIDAEIEEGISAFVGPNGAGKSSLGATIMGLSGYTDIKGDILFEGRSIKHLRLDERARLGITLAWQEPARYEGLKV